MKRIHVSGWEAERAGLGWAIRGRRQSQPNGFPELFGFRRLQVLLLGAAALTACTGGGSGDGDGGLDGGGGGGAGGGAGGAGGSDTCQAPAGATILVDYRDFRRDPGDVTDSSVAYSVAANGTDVHVGFLETVVRVPQAGGAPTVIHEIQSGLGLDMTGLAHGGILIRDGAEIFDETGTPLIYPVAEHPGGSLNAPAGTLVAPSGDIYVRFDDRSDDLEATVTQLVVRRLSAGAQAIVARDVDAGWGRAMVFGAGALYTNTSPPPGEFRPDPDTIVRIEEGGTATAVSVDRPGPVFLVTDQFIYYNRDETAPLEELGVWRVPVGGGAGEKLGGSFGGFTGVADGDQVVLANTSSLYVIDDRAGATLEKIADLPVRSTLDDSCTFHGLAVANGEVIGTMFDQAREMALIFKYPLP